MIIVNATAVIILLQLLLLLLLLPVVFALAVAVLPAFAYLTGTRPTKNIRFGPNMNIGKTLLDFNVLNQNWARCSSKFHTQRYLTIGLYDSIH